MKRKSIIYMVIVIIAILSISSVSAFEIFGFKFFEPSTDFDTKFMSGTFQGEVVKNNLSKNISDSDFKDWSASYEDKENNITYNMSCVKNGSFILDLYELQGLPAPETRHYGDADWKIYFSQAVPTAEDNSSNESSNASSNETINVYICAAEYEGANYIINIMDYGNKLDCDGSLFCELFTDEIEPLLESITFKKPKGAPEMYEVLNVTEDEFEQLSEYMEMAKAGNLTEEV